MLESFRFDCIGELYGAEQITPTLTSIAEKGVLFNFYTASNQIKFEINEKAVRGSGLSINYLLLNVARIVEPAGDSE